LLISAIWISVEVLAVPVLVTILDQAWRDEGWSLDSS